MFEVGDYVVYGYNGVCKVVDFTKMSSPGAREEKEYYVLEPASHKTGRVFVPIGGNKVTLRRVMTKEEALELLSEMKDIEPLVIESDKHREEEYKKVMISCDYRQWVRIIKTLYLRMKERQEKGLSVTAMDNRYWKAAEGYLHYELALALDKDVDEIQDYIGEYVGESA